MPEPHLTDAQLDAMIEARLALLGIDLGQLPPGTEPDPATGSPGRDTAMAALRDFSRERLPQLARYRLPTPPLGRDGDDHDRQQSFPPLLYPSVATEWRK